MKHNIPKAKDYSFYNLLYLKLQVQAVAKWCNQL